ncbi:hypothetical protein [Streptomyces sp. NBC_01727]|uniref:hypothetical protein n=1 Tax=Streptomyces sp. NBC_01727 TaxID=2975924 RepID=UPI002E0D95EC|nr:hypothetical protein OIE76_41260 [Streptomyces sp. NBC_01727]
MAKGLCCGPAGILGAEWRRLPNGLGRALDLETVASMRATTWAARSSTAAPNSFA